MALIKACTAAFTLATSLLAPAQSVAVHPDFAAGPPPRYLVPGSVPQFQFPFGSAFSRQLVVFDVARLAMPQAAQIDAIGFARQEGVTTGTRTVDVRFRMGAAALPFDQALPQFDLNWHGTPDEVFALRTLALPVLSASQEILWVPFDHPYVLDRSRDLALESVVTALGGGFGMDYPLASFTSDLGRRAIGQPCPTSGGWVPAIDGLISRATGSLDYHVFRTVANTGVVFLFALTPRTTPLDLGPIGAPGCLLYVDAQVTLAGRTNSEGLSRGTADVRGLRPYVSHLYLQAGIADYFANQLGIITTLALEIRLRPEPPATWISSQGTQIPSVGAPIYGWGGAVLFRY